MNYAAVRAVSMNTLNRQRANIVFSRLLIDDEILSPAQVSLKERIFETEGVLRFDNEVLGHAKVGVSAAAIVQPWLRAHETALLNAMSIFEHERYMLAIDTASRTGSKLKVLISFKRGCKPSDQLKAWLHALILSRQLCTPASRSSHHELRRRKFGDEITSGSGFEIRNQIQQVIIHTLAQVNHVFEDYSSRLKASGWDLDIGALETTFGSRIDFSLIDGRKDK